MWVPKCLNHLTWFAHLKAVSNSNDVADAHLSWHVPSGDEKKISLRGLVYRGSYALIGIKDGVALAEEAGLLHHCGCWRINHGFVGLLVNFCVILLFIQ